METTTLASALKRSRRTATQWHAILTEHLATDETSQQLAERLNCKLSTVELQLKNVTNPNVGDRPRPTKFVEVKTSPAAAAPPQDGALRLLTSNGITVTFAALPPAEYLATALGLST